MTAAITGQALPQSLAIIEYLDEIEPAPPLLPRVPSARALVRAMAQIVACEIHPLCNLRALETMAGLRGAGVAAAVTQ